METINVYFEIKLYAEHVATFYDEKFYMELLPTLEAIAAKRYMIVTESVITD